MLSSTATTTIDRDETEELGKALGLDFALTFLFLPRPFASANKPAEEDPPEKVLLDAKKIDLNLSKKEFDEELGYSSTIPPKPKVVTLNVVFSDVVLTQPYRAGVPYISSAKLILKGTLTPSNTPVQFERPMTVTFLSENIEPDYQEDWQSHTKLTLGENLEFSSAVQLTEVTVNIYTVAATPFATVTKPLSGTSFAMAVDEVLMLTSCTTSPWDAVYTATKRVPQPMVVMGGLNYFGARYYDPEVGIWTSTDPAGEFWNPYSYTGGNPVNLIDPFGLSTWTDDQGNVSNVLNDNDLGVYRALPAGQAGPPAPMGQTPFWDEFSAGGRILFGSSWDNTISSLHTQALKMDLPTIASNSKLGGLFDVKSNSSYAPYGAGTGRMLNGLYSSAESAGNFLAGYNGSTGKFLGGTIGWDTYMKMAGALHSGNWSTKNAASIYLLGTSYGPKPWYGEIEYAGRQIQSGWNYGRR